MVRLPKKRRPSIRSGQIDARRCWCPLDCRPTGWQSRIAIDPQRGGMANLAESVPAAERRAKPSPRQRLAGHPGPGPTSCVPCRCTRLVQLHQKLLTLAPPPEIRVALARPEPPSVRRGRERMGDARPDYPAAANARASPRRREARRMWPWRQGKRRCRADDDAGVDNAANTAPRVCHRKTAGDPPASRDVGTASRRASRAAATDAGRGGSGARRPARRAATCIRPRSAPGASGQSA